MLPPLELHLLLTFGAGESFYLRPTRCDDVSVDDMNLRCGLRISQEE